MCEPSDPVKFKQEYIAHLKAMTGDELQSLKDSEHFDAYLDRVTDVFEYVLQTFDRARYIWNDRLVDVILMSSKENVRTATKMIDARTKPWHISERLEYVRAICQTVIKKFEALN